MPRSFSDQEVIALNIRNSLKLLGIYLCTAFMLGSAQLHADYEAGVSAAFAGDFDTAFREFSVAAEAGLDLAQYNLGILYYTGQGVEQDFVAAFKWTLAAAEQGHLAAQFNLASLYYDGQGIERDRDGAVAWFSRAAMAGHPDAALALAKLYEEGEHVQQDPVLAHAWASMADANSHVDGAALRTTLEGGMSSAQISAARRQFAQWQLER